MSEWIRVTRSNPCPVCGKPDWCTYASDGAVVCCMRTESAKSARNGGWIHRLSEPMREIPKKRSQIKPELVKTDWASIQSGYTSKSILDDAGCLLGVSANSLKRLGCGSDGVNLTFPMVDAKNNIIGIRLRGPNGKRCVNGSKTGIFWPDGIYRNSIQLLFISEGPTDCAAMLDLGFEVIGRPSCLGGVEIIREWLSRMGREVVVMADNDIPKKRPDGSEYRPGLDGATRLAEQIREICRSVRIIKPYRYKDIREWYRHGATAEAVMALVNNQKRFSA